MPAGNAGLDALSPPARMSTDYRHAEFEPGSRLAHTIPTGLPAGLSQSSRRWLAFVLLCVAMAWFGTLDARHLLSSDEGRYAEIAREMMQTGDWVTIRYNGLKYFEKPPFQPWMTALAYEAFGVGQWQARLWVAVCGASAILMTMWAAGRWYGPRLALYTGLVMLAMPTWNIGGHFNSLDMGVSGALAAVLAALLLAQHPSAAPDSRRRWMLAAWAAMAVAVLTKGLIGLVLPGLALVIYTAWSRDLALWRRLHFGLGVPLFLAITVPWFWLVSERNHEFLHFFFVHEHFQRFTSNVHDRGAPWWYFVPQLAAGLLPWTGLWPGLLSLRQTTPVPGLQAQRLLAAWAIGVFGFFSLSSSKLPGYILPMMPAVAVLAALALDRLSDRAWTRTLLVAIAAGAVLALASPLVGRLSTRDTPQSVYQAFVPWAAASALLIAACSAAALRLHRTGRRLGSAAVYALGFFAATTVGLVGHDNFGRISAGAELLPRMRAVLKPDMPLYGVKLLDHTLPFYLNRTLTLVAWPDELDFGTRQEPQKWIPSIDEFLPRWQGGPPSLAVMTPKTFAELGAQGVPMTEVARSTRRVVVSNFELARP